MALWSWTCWQAILADSRRRRCLPLTTPVPMVSFITVARGLRDANHLTNWLYGVALRVAKKERVKVTRRRTTRLAVCRSHTDLPLVLRIASDDEVAQRLGMTRLASGGRQPPVCDQRSSTADERVRLGQGRTPPPGRESAISGRQRGMTPGRAGGVSPLSVIGSSGRAGGVSPLSVIGSSGRAGGVSPLSVIGSSGRAGADARSVIRGNGTGG